MAGVGSILPAAVATVLTDAVAVAVAFGAPLSSDQQHVLLVFAGSVTSIVFTIVALIHDRHVQAAVKLAASPPAAGSSLTPAAPGGGEG